MRLRLWYLWGAFLLLSFIGCRSEKAAFTFQPSGTNPGPEAYAAVLPDSTSIAPTAARKISVSHALAAAASFIPSQSKQITPKPIVPKSLAQSARPIIQLKTKSSATSVARTAINRKTLHLMLGGLLVAGGVVAGLLLGGWLGLGVGALIVLLGYYFLILWLGGPHAWTEIFQEFFNL